MNKKTSPKGENMNKDPLDPFEQEAAEGFSLLNSEEERANLKASTDQAISKLLSKKAQVPTRQYWLSAAALFIVAGLSFVFFFQTKNPAELAINRELSPTETVIKENLQDSADLEPQNSSNQNKQKESTVAVEKSKDLGFQKQSAPASSAQQNSDFKAKSAQAPLKKEEAADNMELQLTEDAHESEISAAPAMTNTLTSSAEKFDKFALVNADISTAAKTAPASPQAEMKKADPKTRSKGSNTGIIVLSQVNYTGGNTVLHKDILKILKKEDAVVKLNLQFTISENGRVDKCNVLEPSALSLEKQMLILKALKNLKNFTVVSTEGSQMPAIYNYEFIP